MRIRPFPSVLVPTLLLAFTVLPACGGGGGGGGATTVTADVGPAGGSLIGTGALAGVELTVPPAALVSTTKISATSVGSSPRIGFAAVGVAAEFGPTGLAFTPAATLRLPFDASRLPFGVVAQDLVVERRDATGVVSQLTPTAIDAAAQRVTVAMAGAATYWVAAVDEVTIDDYLPLATGDRYAFSDGTVVVVNDPSVALPQPPLPNIGFTSVSFFTAGGAVVDGLPLSKFANGFTVAHGSYHYEPGQDIVERHNPLRLFQTTVRTGEVLTDGTGYEFYRMPDGINPIEIGDIDYGVTITRAPAMTVPAGSFPDVVRVELVRQRVPIGGTAEVTRTVLFLARGVGLIRIEAAFAPNANLVAAELN
ncbi:MAG: hypothetical protein AB7O97_00025 [Planctomycetota bacterium]